MDTKQLIEILEVIQKIVTITAILAGGIWAIFKFHLKREHIWNLEMITSPEQLDYSEKLCFLIVKVSLKNVGSVKITPGSKGLELTIKKVLPSCDKNIGLDWWDIEEEVFGPKDILAKYKENGKKDYEEEVYNLAPGGVYNENQGIILERGYLYLLRLNFWSRGNKDNMVEYAYTYCG